MMQPKCILLDIEGTTSSISFVHDVMFPYVREHLVDFLEQHWGQPAVADCLPLLAADLGHADVESWLDDDSAAAKAAIVAGVNQLMDGDVKATGLKKLQGQIWKSGFESGQMTAHVYDDVVPAIDRWLAAGSEIRIYSSGSVQAQNLFFGHTVAGNLLPKFSGHYDTTVGSKKESASYEKIVAEIGCSAADVVFVSDVVAELQAAQASGLNTVLSIRPGNEPVDEGHGFESVDSFDKIDFATLCS